MATPENAPDAVLAVADPNTSADDLRLIAAVRPDLHTAIAAHPNVYPGLLDWMESLGNPEVVAAVAQRRAFDAGAVPASAPTAQSADASTQTFVDAIEQPETQVQESAQDVTLEPTQVEEEPETTVDHVTLQPETVVATSEEPAVDEPVSEVTETEEGESEQADAKEPETEETEEVAVESQQIAEYTAPDADSDAIASEGIDAEQPAPEQVEETPVRQSIFPESTVNAEDGDHTTVLPTVNGPQASETDSFPAADQGAQYAQTPAYAPTHPQSTMPTQGQMPVGYMPAGAISQQGYQQPMNYQGQYPVQGVPMQPAKNSTNKSLVIILAVLVVIVIVLAIGVAGAFAGWFDSGSSSDTSADSMTQSAQTNSQTPAQPQSAQTNSQTPEQPQSAKPEVKEKYPAPSSAEVADTFSAPSGNIICTLGGDMVSCQINETHWTGAAGYEVCGDNRGALFTVDSKNTNYACANIAPPMNGKYISSLAYGSYVKNGNVACISTQDGISCWNTISGKSFAIAREGWMFDTKGEILPSQFIWNQ